MSSTPSQPGSSPSPNDHYRHTLVLWCAHCWLMDVWEHTPRLLFISPEAGCGKTRALTVTNILVPRPDHVADLTPAALYHSIDEALELKGGRPTVLFDEFDTVFGSAETGRIRNEEMRRLINAGHDRNEKLARKMGKNVKLFRLYTPMALAGKMSIDDVPATIRTRTITIPMQRRLPETRRSSGGTATSTRPRPRSCAGCCSAGPNSSTATPSTTWDRIARCCRRASRTVTPTCWEPLLTIAELAGGHWPERARVAAVAAVAADGVKATPSPGIELLADIKAVFDQLHGEAIFTANLLAELASMDPRWRRLDGKRLARMLHGYGINQTHQ